MLLFSLENATVTKQERNVQNLSEELIIQDLNNLKVEEIKVIICSLISLSSFPY